MTEREQIEREMQERGMKQAIWIALYFAQLSGNTHATGVLMDLYAEMRHVALSADDSTF